MSMEDEPTKEEKDRAGKLRVAIGVLERLIDECESDDEGDENREFLTDLKDDLAHVEAVILGTAEEDDEGDDEGDEDE